MKKKRRKRPNETSVKRTRRDVTDLLARPEFIGEYDPPGETVAKKFAWFDIRGEGAGAEVRCTVTNKGWNLRTEGLGHKLKQHMASKLFKTGWETIKNTLETTRPTEDEAKKTREGTGTGTNLLDRDVIARKEACTAVLRQKGPFGDAALELVKWHADHGDGTDIKGRLSEMIPQVLKECIEQEGLLMLDCDYVGQMDDGTTMYADCSSPSLVAALANRGRKSSLCGTATVVEI